MGFSLLSVGSYGLLPVESVQKAHGIVVTLQQKHFPLRFMHTPVSFCGFSKTVNSPGSKLPFQVLIPFILSSLSPMMLGKEKPPVAHFALCSYISTHARLCAYMHMCMNVIVHARVCVITSSRCHTILLDYVSLTQ